MTLAMAQADAILRFLYCDKSHFSFKMPGDYTVLAICMMTLLAFRSLLFCQSV